MKLSVDNGNVVCSLDNKNSAFLFDCYGMFDGFINGKLKLYHYEPKDGALTIEGASKSNADIIGSVLNFANKHGIEVSSDVMIINDKLQSVVKEIEERERVIKERVEHEKNWELRCKFGCKNCPNLAYNIDLPICKKTGDILEEKNIPKYLGGVLHLFYFEPFPSKDCPFNIKNKEQINECISEIG